MVDALAITAANPSRLLAFDSLRHAMKCAAGNGLYVK